MQSRDNPELEPWKHRPVIDISITEGATGTGRGRGALNKCSYMKSDTVL